MRIEGEIRKGPLDEATKKRLRDRLYELQAKGIDAMTYEELDEWSWIRGYWPIIKPEKGE